MPSPHRVSHAAFALLAGTAIGIGAGAPILLALLTRLAALAEQTDRWVPRMLALVRDTGLSG